MSKAIIIETLKANPELKQITLSRGDIENIAFALNGGETAAQAMGSPFRFFQLDDQGHLSRRKRT